MNFKTESHEFSNYELKLYDITALHKYVYSCIHSIMRPPAWQAILRIMPVRPSVRLVRASNVNTKGRTEKPTIGANVRQGSVWLHFLT